jgi:hypothetical protein
MMEKEFRQKEFLLSSSSFTLAYNETMKKIDLPSLRHVAAYVHRDFSHQKFTFLTSFLTIARYHILNKKK